MASIGKAAFLFGLALHVWALRSTSQSDSSRGTGAGADDDKAISTDRNLKFPKPLLGVENEELNELFKRIVTSKKVGDAAAWWNHNDIAVGDGVHMKVQSRKLFAGSVEGAEIADANQAKGQSGSAVMWLVVDLEAFGKSSKGLNLIIKTNSAYPAPDPDFYLQGIYDVVPEVFLDVFAVEGDAERGFTMVMEKFGNSFPAKPGMTGYDPSAMLSKQLPAVLKAFVRFHGSFWNDPGLVPPSMAKATGVQNEGLGWLTASPIHLNVKGKEWMTDMSIGNVMKGLGADGLELVGVNARFYMLKMAFPGDGTTVFSRLFSQPPTYSYRNLLKLAGELRNMHGLPLGITGQTFIKPNQDRKTFFEETTKDHWTLVHGDAKFENVLLDVETGQAKLFDFDLVGLGSGPMDLATLFISLWEDAAEKTETDLKAALDAERELVLEPYFHGLKAHIPAGRAAPDFLHIADRYYGSGSVSSVLIMNLLEARGNKAFYDFLPRSVSFLKRCIYYWTNGYRSLVQKQLAEEVN
eukprot:TRINITY_DN102595_c0_g1_i1.p1 TRINITY_DN102595_c0_g1~~TRINITY_DN102595_c0_g1_i1.p1  ORF type:complete len:523 (-),score=104.06 TRINITY_DN102595_c0_g1_i1:280-1848(-)